MLLNIIEDVANDKNGMVDSNENEHAESGEIVPELISQIAKLRKSVKKCEVLQEELDTLRGSFLEQSLVVRSLQEELARTAKSEFFNFKTKNKNTRMHFYPS